MSDNEIFIGGMIVGVMLSYFAGLLKSNAPTHIHFIIDAEEVRLKEKSNL